MWQSNLVSFLKIGITCASLQTSGNIPLEMELLISWDRDSETISLSVLRILVGILQGRFLWSQDVGNKATGRISKRVLKENKASQIFRKTNISYLLIRSRTHRVRNVRFSENVASFAFCNNRFEISPFALLPTKWAYKITDFICTSKIYGKVF